MSDDSLENIYAFAEKAYVRMQAGDVLIHCLDDSSVEPMHQMVETLLLAGPENLEVIKEILAETSQRKTQVDDDMQQVISGLKTNLEGYGIRLHSVRKPSSLSGMKPARFLKILREQGVQDEHVQTTCLQMLYDSRDLIDSLQSHYNLLAELEAYLQDWMWGVVYDSVHQGRDQTSLHPFPTRLS
jgi:hypothetical protein